ncbi:MAG: hypothetical protein QNJ74_28200 [Trichodesmium sp. MO_231.B1]|nr:hypothetical protein [Trichodesmium sp. MO_231.B1]
MKLFVIIVLNSVSFLFKITITKDLSDKSSSENISTSEPTEETSPEIISSPEPTPSPQPEFSIQTFTTVTVNTKGEIISRRKDRAEVMTENFNGVSLEMVKIPGGTFPMESPQTEGGRDDDQGPQHNRHLQTRGNT